MEGPVLISTSLVRKVVRAEYSLLRGSVQAFDTRVAARYLPDDSPVRAVFGRGLTVLDAAAAHLLRSDQRPAHPSSTGSPDAADEGSANSNGATTDGATTAGATDSTAADIPVEEVERVAEELLEERSQTPLTGELAEESQDDVLTMAELRAKHIVEEYEMQQREKSQD
jgi:hypothetical protein